MSCKIVVIWFSYTITFAKATASSAISSWATPFRRTTSAMSSWMASFGRTIYSWTASFRRVSSSFGWASLGPRTIYIGQMKISKFTMINKQTIFTSAKQTLIITSKKFFLLSNSWSDNYKHVKKNLFFTIFSPSKSPILINFFFIL